MNYAFHFSHIYPPFQLIPYLSQSHTISPRNMQYYTSVYNSVLILMVNTFGYHAHLVCISYAHASCALVFFTSGGSPVSNSILLASLFIAALQSLRPLRVLLTLVAQRVHRCTADQIAYYHLCLLASAVAREVRATHFANKRLFI